MTALFAIALLGLCLLGLIAISSKLSGIESRGKSIADSISDLRRVIDVQDQQTGLHRQWLKQRLDLLNNALETKRPAHRYTAPEAIDYETSQRLALEKLERDNSHGVPV